MSIQFHLSYLTLAITVNELLYDNHMCTDFGWKQL